MDKTYVFDNNDGGCCGGNNMMPLIAALCQNRGVDPNMLAAMMNNRNDWGDGAYDEQELYTILKRLGL